MIYQKTTGQVSTLGDYLVLETRIQILGDYLILETRIQILKSSFIDIVNNRSDLRKFLLSTRDYGKNIQENINAVVADRKFNQAVVRRALDQKNKRVF